MFESLGSSLVRGPGKDWRRGKCWNPEPNTVGVIQAGGRVAVRDRRPGEGNGKEWLTAFDLSSATWTL